MFGGGAVTVKLGWEGERDGSLEFFQTFYYKFFFQTYSKLEMILHYLDSTINILKKILYLFIYGYVGSLFLCKGFL